MNSDTSIRTTYARRAAWYVVSGILFILTGILTYLQVSIYSLGSLLLIGAGIVVILLGFFRYHPTSDALVVFIISLLVFSLFSSGSFTFTAQSRTFSFTRAQPRYQMISKLALSVSESVGSIDVAFVDDANLIVNLTYGRRSGSAFFPPFFGSFEAPSVTNVTSGTSLMVSGSAGISSLTVLIGNVDVSSLNAKPQTGSLSIRIPDNAKVTSLDVETSTGSISITFATRTLTSLRAVASTGSVNIDAQYRDLPRNATLFASASTGSVDLILNTNSNIGVDLSATASTTFGSINMATLSGYASPTLQNKNALHVRTLNYSSATRYLQATLSASIGSVDITAASGTTG